MRGWGGRGRFGWVRGVWGRREGRKQGSKKKIQHRDTEAQRRKGREKTGSLQGLKGWEIDESEE